MAQTQLHSKQVTMHIEKCVRTIGQPNQSRHACSESEMFRALRSVMTLSTTATALQNSRLLCL